ncbi:glycosyltransferase family 4 protein [Brachybacterium sp. p3-SID957]|uniref:glycosyltransferase family 4 protein n=1 Tax=Brachybacterium sp. p3-SID957 TaxID=2916049 RepID=UPI00223BAE96|nr:glycosyltransferase family 4 protein [Brachybacterium sp. p3-SID957]MCT1777144.1 glycosyltransferase family 4 protein [Brachybacterium sp. p3-SID957]
MKILVLSQYYAPENVPIPEQVARGLAARGHHVQVLTTFPSYPRGKVFDGYRQSLGEVEMREGIRITRLPTFTDHSMNPARRALSYASFAASSGIATKLIRGADVIYVYATQLTAAGAPWLHRLLGGTPYVVHVQDLWPDSVIGSSLVRSGMAQRIVGGVIDRWAASVYEHASAAVAIAPTMACLLAERGAGDRVRTIPNWTNESHEVVKARQPVNSRGRTEILYAGNIGDMQNLEVAVEAAHRTAESGVVLRLVGAGTASESVGRKIVQLGAQNVLLGGPVPPSAMPQLYAESDFSLVSLKDLEVFRATIPSKFQASLFHGIPVIAAVAGDLSQVVAEYRVGLLAEPSSVDSLAAAFRKAASLSVDERRSMRERCSVVYRKNFSQESGLGGIEDVLIASAVERNRTGR